MEKVFFWGGGHDLTLLYECCNDSKTLQIANVKCMLLGNAGTLPYLWRAVPVFHVVNTMQNVWTRLGLI